MPDRLFFPLLLALGSASSAAQANPWTTPEIAGLMTDERLAETSGLAPARRHPGRFWTHNDSGHPSELHLMSATGTRIASVLIDGVRSVDWEDMAGFELDGRPYLLVADIGDNGGLRRELTLTVIEEPAPVLDGMRVKPAWTLRLRWPDGARDAEAVAVDAAAGDVLLVSKKRVPPELFRIRLRPGNDDVQVAERIGLLGGIAQPEAAELARNPRFGRYRSQVTAADLSPDGRTLAVLNYQAVYLYTRAPDQGWASALGAPKRLDFAWMPQAETTAFGLEGDLWVAGEQRPSPLLRFRRDPP